MGQGSQKRKFNAALGTDRLVGRSLHPCLLNSYPGLGKVNLSIHYTTYASSLAIFSWATPERPEHIF